jgi:soluble epoxide hydrolase/lipid-phosphate phosphatase
MKAFYLTSTQYLPAAGDEMIPVEALSKALPKLSYQSHFEKRTSQAATELNKDIRRTIRATLRTVASKPPDAFLRSRTSFLKAYRHMDTIPPVPFFSPEEEDYYVEEYLKQGFDYSECRWLLHVFPLDY